MATDVFVHAGATNESTDVGEGTRIWGFTHVMEGASIGRDCNIGEQCFIERGARIGDGVTIKNGVSVWEGVTLANYVFVGPNAVFTNDRFPRSARGPAAAVRYDDRSWLEPTLVGEGASLGANVTILCGVQIGRYALVGVGAVVLQDVPDHALVTGHPARRRGHVCQCGLPFSAGSSYVCETCGRTYRLVDDGLELSAPPEKGTR